MARAASLLMLLALAPTAGHATPRVPTDDGELLERVAAADDPVLRDLRVALAAKPDDPARVYAFVRRAIGAARATGDPRPIGQAEAALARLGGSREPGAEALRLRATLRQWRHDFEGAERDLERSLRLDARSPETWLAHALVMSVQGRPEETRRSCAALLPLGARLVATTCLALAAGLTGHAHEGRSALERELESAAPPDDQRRFSLETLADLALAEGDDAGGERYFVRALALPAPDVTLRAAYADLLLRAGRASEAKQALADATRSDVLLLRAWLAARALGDPAAELLEARLEQRFAALRARGEAVHQREEARFRLARGETSEALALARANFTRQREVEDARLLLEAARLAGDPDAAAPVAAWMRETGLVDARLALPAAAETR
jgi:Tfp pilus assembly protein PilF